MNCYLIWIMEWYIVSTNCGPKARKLEYYPLTEDVFVIYEIYSSEFTARSIILEPAIAIRFTASISEFHTYL